MPLVSVIVPVYNTENYLKRCIESVLSQTCGDFELILVDDGSKDSSPAICDEYAKTDSRIRVIHKINEGPGIARNAALDTACGEYISYVDSDDWIKPEMLEKMVDAAKKYHADVVVCGYSYFNGLEVKDAYISEGFKLYDRSSLMKDYLSTSCITPASWNKLFKRVLFDNIRYPKMNVGEDQYIMHEIFSRCNTGVHIGEPLYIQYIRPGSITKSKFNKNMLGVLESSLRLQHYITEEFPDLYEYVELTHANCIIYAMTEIIRTFSYKEYRALYKQLKKQLMDERSRINGGKNPKQQDEKTMRKINQACDCGTCFYLGNIYEGVKKRFKSLVKYLLIKAR